MFDNSQKIIVEFRLSRRERRILLMTAQSSYLEVSELRPTYFYFFASIKLTLKISVLFGPIEGGAPRSP
jgi:hypothetical protein